MYYTHHKYYGVCSVLSKLYIKLNIEISITYDDYDVTYDVRCIILTTYYIPIIKTIHCIYVYAYICNFI